MDVSPFVLDVFDPKLALLETARELGVIIVAYSPLGRGLLTGQYVSISFIFVFCFLVFTLNHETDIR
jgi:Aldo/keto reductase family